MGCAASIKSDSVIIVESIPLASESSNEDIKAKNEEIVDVKILYSKGMIPLSNFNLQSGSTFPTFDILRLSLERADYVFREDLFTAHDFVSLDKAAMETDFPFLNGSFEELINSFQQTSSTVLGIVRMCFRWITHFDYVLRTSKIEFKHLNSKSPLAFIEKVANDKKSHNALFVHLMNTANISVREICGVVKGAGYQIGYHVNEDEHFGSWIAVKLDTWRLIDLRWACRVLEGHQDNNWACLDKEINLVENSPESQIGSVSSTLNENYFLTDPHIFVCTHWPRDSQWQLLPQPISLSEFEEMAHVTASEMSSQGLQLVTHPKGVFVISESQLSEHERRQNLHIKDSRDNVVEFEDNREDSIYCADLQIAVAALTEANAVETIRYKTRDYGIQSFAMLSHNAKDKRIRIYLQPPVKAKYMLDLYGGNRNTSTLKHLVSYVFYCQKDTEGVVPLPVKNLTEWGPGGHCTLAGLWPLTHPEAMIEAPTGEVLIRMEFRRSGLCCLPRLVNIANQNLDQNVMYWEEKDNKEAVFKVRLPEPGLFALSIAVRQPDATEENNFNICCEYLIDSQRSCDYPQDKYPKQLNKRIGPIVSRFHEFGITIFSPKTCHIDCCEKEYCITWQVREMLDFVLYMTLEDGALGDCNFNRYTQVELNDNWVTFRLRFPINGFYAFLIFVKSKSGEEELNVQLVYKYLIHVTKMPYFEAPLFAEVTDYYHENKVCLKGPRNYLLNSGQNYVFSVECPDSVTAAVVRRSDNEGSNFTSLCDLTNEGKNTWTGRLETGKQGFIEMAFKTEKSVDEFQCGIKFKIKDTEEIKKSEILLARALAKYKECYKMIDYEGTPKTLSKNDEESAENLEIELRRAQEKQLDTVSSSELTDKERAEKTAAAEIVASAQHQKLAIAHLKDAMMQKDQIELEKSISEYEALNVENSAETFLVLRTAKDLLTRLKYKSELEQTIFEARQSLTNDVLQKVLEKISNDRLSTDALLLKSVTDANELLERIKRINRLKSQVLQLDRNVMMEIRSMNNPLQIVHKVMIATLLLLGVYERRTRRWRRLTPLLKDAVFKKIKTFDHTKVHPEIAARANEILTEFESHEVMNCSPAAGAFYDWSKSMLQEIESSCENKRDFKPAGLKRQKNLLKISDSEERELVWGDKSSEQ